MSGAHLCYVVGFLVLGASSWVAIFEIPGFFPHRLLSWGLALGLLLIVVAFVLDINHGDVWGQQRQREEQQQRQNDAQQLFDQCRQTQPNVACLSWLNASGYNYERYKITR